MNDPLIICDNLVKIYRVAERDVVALQGLDMVVPRGDLLGVVGVSGSGKSTLMNILGGLDRPTAGRVWVDGKDLLKMSDPQLDSYRLSKVGFVWQQTSRNLVPYLTAQQNVEMPLRLAGRVGDTCRRRALELLEVVGISARRSHRLSELSGGEQQRVGIAVALANQPMLLLADEPTGEVDEKTAHGLYQLFGDLNRQLELTTLIVSHDPNLAQYVHRVVSIRDGKIATESKLVNGIPEEATNEAEFQAADTPARDADAHELKPRWIIEELTVVDSAGRLQIPKEYLEALGIRGRARLELVEAGILVQPTAGVGFQPEHLYENVERLIDRLEEERQSRQSGRGWMSGLRWQLRRASRRLLERKGK
jgi:ABC-type lipoprotein export system ATPase subunit/bifunctional DNA-binding transcriptional regulator/antitoxin component of YhaV-PrlF toxin-antitoxin module